MLRHARKQKIRGTLHLPTNSCGFGCERGWADSATWAQPLSQWPLRHAKYESLTN